MQNPQLLEFYPLISGSDELDNNVLGISEGGATKLSFHPSDIINLHIDNSFLKDFDLVDNNSDQIKDIGAFLFGYEPNATTPTILEKVGDFRKMETEYYYSLTLLFRGLPDSYNQFSILREDGREVFGTYKEQHDTLESYIQGVADWLESYPFTPISTEINGNYLHVSIYKDSIKPLFNEDDIFVENTYQNFILDSEKLSIGLGEVTEFNTNTPSIEKVLKVDGTGDGRRIVDIEISDDITAGNTFRFGLKTYKASDFDTPESIKEYFFEGRTQYEGLLTENMSVSVEKGQRVSTNTNIPKINALYFGVVTSKDAYTIEIDNFQAGNIFIIDENDNEKLTYTVSESDTKASIEAFFNNSGGYYKVNQGVRVNTRTITGFQKKDNTNNPSISVKTIKEIEGSRLEEWDIYVGTSVRKGNIFVLDDRTVIAEDGDDYQSIGIKLGLTEGNRFLFQKPTGDEENPKYTFECTAKKGAIYGEESISNVEIVGGIKSYKSNHFRLSVNLAKTERRGSFNLLLRRYAETTGFLGTFAKSQAFEISDSANLNSSVVSFRGQGNSFGFDYFDKSIYQQIRLPLTLNEYNESITEARVRDINGKEDVTKVEIVETARFGTSILSKSQCKALIYGLKSKDLFINGRPCETSDVNMNPVVGASNKYTVSGSVSFTDSVRNNHNKQVLGLNYLETVRIINGSPLHLIYIELKNTYLYNKFNGAFDESVLPIECYPVVFVAGFDDVNFDNAAAFSYQNIAIEDEEFLSFATVKIYKNGYFIAEEAVKKGRKNKLKTKIKFEPNATYEFRLIENIDIKNIGFEMGSYVNQNIIVE